MNSHPKAEQEFRQMNGSERILIDRLLEHPFRGSADLIAQISNCLVRSIDDNGSLNFMVTLEKRAATHSPVPVEAEAEDIDGTTVHILLHVINGIAQGLEVYKEDSSHVIQFPAPSELRLFTPP